MLLDKVKTFNEARKEYFIKRRKAIEALYDLDASLGIANVALQDTIDNGLDNKYLVDVATAYNEHKFNSDVVSGFINKIDDMLLKGLEPKLKENLEVVSIDIRLNYDGFFDEQRKYVDGPVSIEIYDSTSNRHFTVYIPIKDSMHRHNVDMVTWANGIAGLYVVKAVDPQYNPENYSFRSITSKKICKVFDQTKVVDAVQKYLNGEFDDDLHYETLSIKDFTIATNNEIYHGNDETYYNSDFANKHLIDMNILNCSHKRPYGVDLNDVVSNCICDIGEYDSSNEKYNHSYDK